MTLTVNLMTVRTLLPPLGLDRGCSTPVSTCPTLCLGAALMTNKPRLTFTSPSLLHLYQTWAKCENCSNDSSETTNKIVQFGKGHRSRSRSNAHVYFSCSFNTWECIHFIILSYGWSLLSVETEQDELRSVDSGSRWDMLGERKWRGGTSGLHLCAPEWASAPEIGFKGIFHINCCSLLLYTEILRLATL